MIKTKPCLRFAYVCDNMDTMIKELLAYQEKDKERLALVLSVENGRVKREMDTANRAIEDAKQNLLALENDARSLTSAFESVGKNLRELFERVEQYNKTASSNKSEDEIQSAASYVSALLQKVTGYENQLDDISKRIAAKAAAFEDAKTAVIRAQKNIAALTPQYQSQLKEIQPKVSVLEAELKKLEAGINKDLLERYKKRRVSDKSGKVIDIAVAVVGERCGGCYHEMPTLLVHKIKTNGYIICENCGKIIY